MAGISWKKGDYFRSADGFGVVIDNSGTVVLVTGRIGQKVVKGGIPEDAVKADPSFFVPATRMALLGALAAVSD